jgi:hypothetical protein
MIIKLNDTGRSHNATIPIIATITIAAIAVRSRHNHPASCRSGVATSTSTPWQVSYIRTCSHSAALAAKADSEYSNERPIPLISK